LRMCKWHCNSQGPSTNLECLHCKTRYCGACLHGAGGIMENLDKCASCGKVPTQLNKEDRPGWNEATQLDSTAGTKPVEAKAATATSGGGSEADQLQEIFSFYCNRAPKSDALDNSKWAKALTDLLWLDDKMTKTDGDLIFSKVKPKGGRKLQYDEFVVGVHEVAKKRYGADDISQLLRNTTIPKSQADAASPNVVDRLTNPATFTGSSKQRFDEDGKGKGFEGRDATGANDKLIVGKVIPGGKKINLAESLREDVSDGSAKNATHCPQCNAPRKSDQRSCARCGKQFF